MKKHSPLYNRIKKAVDGKFRQLSKDKIDPWKNFNIRKNVKIQKCDGSFINFEGVNFSGSIQSALWASDFIPPFIEQVVSEVVAWTLSQCEENKLSPESPMKETCTLLKEHVKKLYNSVTKIDRRLIAEGFPEQLALRSVNDEIKAISQFINEHIASEEKLWKSRTNNTEKVAKPSKVNREKAQDFPPHHLEGWNQVKFCLSVKKCRFEVYVDGALFSASDLKGNGLSSGHLDLLMKIVQKNGFFDKDTFPEIKNISLYVERLNKSLRKTFKINQLPISYNLEARGYKAAFKNEIDHSE